VPLITSLEPGSLEADPGGQASCTLSVRNTSTIVERYGFAVLGPAGAWASVDPGAISLLPDAERTVTVTFRPPRAAATTATSYPFAVKVLPTDHPDDTAVEEGELTVRAFSEVTAACTPRTSRGARAGHHVIRVSNRGNTPVEAAISASDPDELLTFRIRPVRVRASAGSEVRARVDVKPRRTKTFGVAEPRPFQIRVDPGGSTPSVLDASFLQRALLPRWLPRAAAVVALAVVGTLLYANHKAKVSNVAKVVSTTIPTTVPPPTTKPGGGATTTTKGGPTTAPGGATTTTTTPGAAIEPGLTGALACTTYDPGSVNVVVPATSSATSTTAVPLFQVTAANGQVSFRMASDADAEVVKSILTQYNQVCYIGNGGPPELRAMTLEPFEAGLPDLPATVHAKCDNYTNSPKTLIAEPPDATHPDPWLADTSVKPVFSIQSFDNFADALLGAKLAQAHTQRCWVGTNAKFSTLADNPDGSSVFEYWK